MNIVLINPSSSPVYKGYFPPVQVPLGLAYIAAVLEQHRHRVRVVDLQTEDLDREGLARRVGELRPDIVGVTCTTPLYPAAREICDTVKAVSPAVTTVMGGMHPTVLPEETLRQESVDFAVIGEGERTVVELVEALESRRDPAGIPGIGYRKDGAVRITGRRELIPSLDGIPFPARHLFKTQAYTFPDALSKHAFPLLTARGCTGECTYCGSRNMWGRAPRFRSPENVVDEIEALIRRYRAEEIHIIDDNFALHRQRVFAIRDEMKKRGIRIPLAFPNGIRADCLDREMLACLKDMGAYGFFVGVESGSQAVLDRTDKKLSLEKVSEILRIARELDLETWAIFVIGLMGETRESVRETIRFALALDPDVAKFHILKPYPGTRVYDELKEKGLLLHHDYARYCYLAAPVHRLPGLTPEEMVYWQREAYRRFFLRPKKIAQHLLRLRSFNRLRVNALNGLHLLWNILK